MTTLAVAARRERRIHLQRLRHLAVAEQLLRRMQAGLTKAEGLIDHGLSVGYDMSTEVGQITKLRANIAAAEADFADARRAAGLADAA